MPSNIWFFISTRTSHKQFFNHKQVSPRRKESVTAAVNFIAFTSSLTFERNLLIGRGKWKLNWNLSTKFFRTIWVDEGIDWKFWLPDARKFPNLKQEPRFKGNKIQAPFSWKLSNLFYCIFEIPFVFHFYYQSF